MNFRKILISTGLSCILGCSNIQKNNLDPIKESNSSKVNLILNNVVLYDLLLNLHINLNEILEKFDIKNICDNMGDGECIYLLKEIRKNIADLNLLLNIGLESSFNIIKTKDEQIVLIKEDLNKLKEQLKYLPICIDTNRLVWKYKELINLLEKTTLCAKM